MPLARTVNTAGTRIASSSPAPPGWSSGFCVAVGDGCSVALGVGVGVAVAVSLGVAVADGGGAAVADDDV